MYRGCVQAILNFKRYWKTVSYEDKHVFVYIVTFVYWNIVYIESCMHKSILNGLKQVNKSKRIFIKNLLTMDVHSHCYSGNVPCALISMSTVFPTEVSFKHHNLLPQKANTSTVHIFSCWSSSQSYLEVFFNTIWRITHKKHKTKNKNSKTNTNIKTNQNTAAISRWHIYFTLG
jgi:hypothetical protein